MKKLLALILFIAVLATACQPAVVQPNEAPTQAAQPATNEPVQPTEMKVEQPAPTATLPPEEGLPS